jgi:hypothetical protein
MDSDDTSGINVLQAQIALLDTVRVRLSGLRRAPATLLPQQTRDTGLHMPLPDVFTNHITLAQHFSDLKGLASVISAPETQGALKNAAERVKDGGSLATIRGWRVEQAKKTSKYVLNDLVPFQIP